MRTDLARALLILRGGGDGVDVDYRELRKDSITGRPAWMLTKFARDTLSPWLNLWRRMAAARDVSPMAALKSGALGLFTLHDAYFPRAAARFLGGLELELAILNLQRGDAGTAEDNVRETLSGSLHSLRGPRLTDVWVASVLVQEAAGILLEIAEQAKKPGLRAEAELLDLKAKAAQDQIRQLKDLTGLLGSDDTTMTLMVRTLADSTLPPFMRLSLATGIAAGFCHNPRELLLGVNPSRRLVLKEAGRRLTSIPHASKFITVIDLWLQAIDEGETDLLLEDLTRLGIAPHLVAGVFRRVGLSRFAARLYACDTWDVWFYNR